MKSIMRMATIAFVSVPILVNAAELETAAAIEAKTTKAAVISQQHIDASANAALNMKAEITQRQQDIENLTLYRNHLHALVADQTKESGSLNQQINDIKQTRKGVVPLMYRMIDDLATWTENDLPIKSETRQARIASLKAMMGRADVADAEKFRRILEAFLVELAYGSKLGLYQETLVLDGITRDVDVLHLGRLSLIARSLDSETFWFFDKNDSGWVMLDKAQTAPLETAFSVANQQRTPELLSLPLSISPSAGEEGQ